MSSTGTQDTHDGRQTARRLRAISDELSDRFHEQADVVRPLVVRSHMWRSPMRS